MATIGTALTVPEAGWERLDDRDVNITYNLIGTQSSNTNNHNSTYTAINNDSEIKFNFTGHSLRLLGSLISADLAFDIFIDAKPKITKYCPANTSNKILFVEINDLQNIEHSITIKNFNTSFRFDAIDIISGKTLNPYKLSQVNKTLISLSSGEYKTLEKGSEGTGKFSIVPKMTSNTLPSGVASANTEHSSPYSAWCAFDGVKAGATNRWISKYGGSGWLMYDFGGTNKKLVSKYSITGIDFSALDQNPKDWTFEGSNDNGGTWIILDSRTGVTDWVIGETKDYIINSSISYQMYRLNISANQNPTVSTTVTELALFEVEMPATPPSWKTVTRTTPTKSDFDTYGIEDLSTITAEQWKQLSQEHPTVELVTYVPTGNAVSEFSNTYEDLELKLNLKGLPVGQIVLSKESMLYGTLTQAVVNQLDDGLPSGIIRILVSFDRGDTWRIYQDGLWKEVYPLTEASFIEKGMTISDLALIGKDDFMLGEDDEISFAYYIEEEIREGDSAKLTDLSLSQTSSINTVELKEASLYILNTVSTIDISLLGTELSGKISDIDLGKVKYRVLLNGNPYYPADGKFTDFQPTPLDISIRVDGASVLIDKSNTLTVEFEDYWGSADFWSTTFIGTYSGLIFKEPTGQAYATEIGQVLKYLDIGTLIAGQKTEDFEILLENSYGYDVENPTIVSYTENEGVVFELSKSNSPFNAQEELTWESVLKDGESLKFYLRIATSIKTPPVMGGAFKLIVNADKV